MSLKLFFAAVALVISPSLAIAQCTGHSEQTASSCVEGFVWDGDAQACVALTNS